MKVGCLNVHLTDDKRFDKDWQTDSCKECIFNEASDCPNDCAGNNHYVLDKDFINAQMNKYRTSRIKNRKTDG